MMTPNSQIPKLSWQSNFNIILNLKGEVTLDRINYVNKQGMKKGQMQI